MTVWRARGPQTAGLRQILLFGALLLVGAGVLAAVFWVAPPPRSARPTSVTVDELLLHVPRGLVRVKGTLVRESLTQQEEPCSAEFRIKGKHGELPVRYAACVLPDTLCDRPWELPEVEVQGQFDSRTLRLEATTLSVWPGKLEMMEGPDGKLIISPQRCR